MSTLIKLRLLGLIFQLRRFHFLGFQDYRPIVGFLHRKTILHVNKLHIRIHTILSEDKTCFIHNHPFYFISIILQNGYTEQLLRNGGVIVKKHKVGDIIFRKPQDFHRISSIEGVCKTLFITWKVKGPWRLKKLPNTDLTEYNFPENKGVYLRNIKGKVKYCKFDEFWHIGNDTIEGALKEERYSIHQCLGYENL